MPEEVDDQYMQRERDFNQSLPGIFSMYGKSLTMADAEAQITYLEFVKSVFAMDNLTISEKISLIDHDPLTLELSIPAVAALRVEPFTMKEARLKMSMTTHASRSALSSVKTETEAKLDATVGWGFLKATVGVKANISTNNEKKRSSDYSATTEAELVMTRADQPECLAKIIDRIGEVVTAGMDMNQKIIDGEMQVQEAMIEQRVQERLAQLQAGDGGSPPAQDAA